MRLVALELLLNSWMRMDKFVQLKTEHSDTKVIVCSYNAEIMEQRLILAANFYNVSLLSALYMIMKSEVALGIV